MNDKKIIWLQLLQIAVYKYGIAPCDFWNMTMKEFNVLFTDVNVNEDLISRKQLYILQKLFPDKGP